MWVYCPGTLGRNKVVCGHISCSTRCFVFWLFLPSIPQLLESFGSWYGSYDGLEPNRIHVSLVLNCSNPIRLQHSGVSFIRFAPIWTRGRRVHRYTHTLPRSFLFCFPLHSSTRYLFLSCVSPRKQHINGYNPTVPI